MNKKWITFLMVGLAATASHAQQPAPEHAEALEIFDQCRRSLIDVATLARQLGFDR